MLAFEYDQQVQTARGRSVHARRLLQLHASHDSLAGGLLSLLPQGPVCRHSSHSLLAGATPAKREIVTWVLAEMGVATLLLLATSRLQTPTVTPATPTAPAPVAAEAEAEAAIPALRHAEEEVRVRGIRCALAGAAGKDRTEAAAALADAKQKLTALLAQSGRPADALEPRFVCPKCQDTGSVNGRTCECVHKVMQQLRRKEIEALSSLSIASFDTMELRYYPNRADEKVGGAIRPYMADMLADLRSYAEEFDHHSESLMLFGNAGLGKTHAALAIAGIVLEKGYDVIYVSSPDFFSKLEGLHFGADPAGEEETLMQTAAGADLLILDDLGSEFNSAFLISSLYSLLNNRLGAKLPTIVTTNITDGALLEKLYTEKISSRLSAFVPCLFAGDDIRTQKAAE